VGVPLNIPSLQSLENLEAFQGNGSNEADVGLLGKK
jgi:hypothetical protein